MFLNRQIDQRRPLSNLSDPCLSPLLNRLYANRGIKSTAELDYHLKHLPRPQLLFGMAEACELMYEALQADASVLIVGDYDVDGATSTVLTKQVLEAFGFSRVAYFIPDRLNFGYGLSEQVVAAVQDYQADVLITVDNGISSVAGVLAARQAGMSVIVTDHHLPGDELPQADAIINPNLPNDQFPDKALAGVGVAFYFMLGLRAYLRQHDWFTENQLAMPNLGDYLDLVAVGTISDLVPFSYVNRLLVSQGLERIRKGRCNLGLQALLKVAEVDFELLSCEDIGFKIAPRLNAAGRIETMSLGVECLLSNQAGQAELMANELGEINEQRKAQTKQGNEQALAIVNEQLENIDHQDKFSLCLYDSAWHQGIIGLIAARVKEAFNRPSVVFTDDKDCLKGSARSITNLHIRDLLAEIALSHPGLIRNFGGHAMAAGLTIDKEGLADFTQQFERLAQNKLSNKNLQHHCVTDGALAACEFNLETACLINQAGPWGVGFDKPLFCNQFAVVSLRRIGQNNDHLQLQLKPIGQDSPEVAAVAFNVDQYLQAEDADIETINAVFNMNVNQFNNLTKLQLILEYFEVN